MEVTREDTRPQAEASSGSQVFQLSYFIVLFVMLLLSVPYLAKQGYQDSILYVFLRTYDSAHNYISFEKNKTRSLLQQLT